MIYNELGKTGMRVSNLSFGASSLGGVFHDIRESEGIKAVHTAVDNGINFIDVSQYYGHYKAEMVLGKALKEIQRDRYYLSTKGGRYGENGVNTWQCAVYYRGAHRSNPFQPKDFLAGNPEREAILDGTKVFDRESARALYPELDFLPHRTGYAPCLCGKKCDVACYNHLKEKNLL